EPGRAEQDPAVYWNALVLACRDLAERRPELMRAVAGIGVTSQRATMICLDKEGRTLRPAILWLDVRKAEPPYRPGLGMRAALGLIGMEEAIMLTQEEGKCNWIMQNEPELWAKTYKYVEVSGYLTNRLTGSFSDSTASCIGHLPFNYKRQDWCKPGELNSRLFPVPREKLPDLVPPGAVIAAVTPEAAAATGLPAGIPLVAAGSDKGCETIGMGVTRPDKASLSFGTTATIQTTSPRYFEPLTFMPAYPAPIPGHFNPEVEIFRGYWMITWFKNQFAYEEVREAEARGIVPEAMLDELLKRTPAGGHGLVMQPYWTPMFKMPSAKGAIIGFGDVHDRAHVYRAIIEGLAYGLKEGLHSMEKAGRAKITELAVSGGASQSDEICRITADVFNLPLVRGATYETSGLGAAMVVAAGLGMYPSVEAAIAAMARRDRVFAPDPRRAELYDKLYGKVYKKMYAALAPLYEEIRDITNYPERL
ncbi:MAG: FGGY-family carbohydrate kinase, partial [Spirochaetaceae bacterium]|nr:FGGY-family carbohydrate kinase [Spirochaetaceae bacterium]